jgi:2Fe-2S ferredoxin
LPKITFIRANGMRTEIEAPRGHSVMEIARDHDLGIEGTCEGSMACATCHVVVEPAHACRLAPVCAEEEEMLDLAFGVQPTSRLGCQIVMSEELDGLVVRIPGG